MDLELGTLAAAAAAAVVEALATSAGEHARTAVAALWGRVRPDRAGDIGSELARARTRVLAARAEHDTEAERALADEWSGRLRDLLGDSPRAAAELRGLVSALAPPPRGAAAARGRIEMRATASGNGRVYQAVGDIQVTER